MTGELADAVNALEDTLQPSAAPIQTTAFTSGTAVQNTADGPRTFCLATATAGSAVIAVSADGTNYKTLVSGKITAATDLLTVPAVPPGFYVKITLTTSAGGSDWTIY